MNNLLTNWSRRHTLIAGLALILLTNTTALLGVAKNRSGEPESELQLTQRELQSPFWSLNKENSGVSLRINWRIPVRNNDLGYYAYSGGAPDWLDEAKMTSLGFDLKLPSPEDTTNLYRWNARQLSREILLVLEMDGPAYQQTLQRVRQKAAEQEAKLAAQPGDQKLQQEAKAAREQVTHEEQQSSRLFAIDAGLDLGALRARYPDRKHYAIVHAKVKPSLNFGEGKQTIVGFINGISIDTINVPHQYHTQLAPAENFPVRRTTDFKANIAFGQRLEPWVTDFSWGSAGN